MSKKKAFHGLQKSAKHPQRNWASEVDYADKLSPAEKQWLSDFNEALHMSGSKAKAAAVGMNDDQRREHWRDYKRAQQDALNYAEHSKPEQTDDPPPNATWDLAAPDFEAEDRLIESIDQRVADAAYEASQSGNDE